MNESRLTPPTLLVSVVTASLLLLCGCSSGGDATSSKVPKAKVGPSGVPEVTVRAANETALRAGFTDFFTKRGYAEGHARFTDEMAFDRPSGESESANKAARVRLRYTRMPDNRWRVVGTPMAVDNWKSSLESERTVASAAKNMQGLLNVVKGQIEAQP